MKTENHIDKSKWPVRGPWDNEPDKAQWVDETTGLDCLMVRARSHWCGYVGVPEEHPAFGKKRDEVDVNVHGGITFADLCQEGEDEPKVCHTPEAGRPAHVWWLGFDCAHAGDYRPPYCAEVYGYEHYRDFNYVRSQVTSLAQQLKVAG